jgi:hypothetical protein
MDRVFSMPEIIFMIPIVAIVGGVLASMVSTVAESIRKYGESREREASRREIAAYVAEGSMTPEDGERLLRAGEPEKPKA